MSGELAARRRQLTATWRLSAAARKARGIVDAARSQIRSDLRVRAQRALPIDDAVG